MRAAWYPSDHGTSRIRIEGVESLRPLDHSVIADRIEAGTFLVAGALWFVVGTLYGAVDAGVGGLIFGWIYNWIAARGAARLTVPPYEDIRRVLRARALGLPEGDVTTLEE